MNLKKLINEYVCYCSVKKNLSSKTIKAYRIDLNQYLKFSSKITKPVINEYIDIISKRYKVRTIKRKIVVLKSFLNYLEDSNYIIQNPFNKIKVKLKQPMILPRIIPFNVLEDIFKYVYALLNSCITEDQSKILCRDISILEILFSTGVRVSEISSLKRKDVDLDNNFIRVMGKGGKERLIQIQNKDVISILKRYESYNSFEKADNMAFFLNRINKPISDQSIRGIIRKYSKKVSDKHITPHMFRHTFATLLLEEDVDIRFIQKILGHSSISTTQIYTYVSLKKQKEVLSIKNPRNKICIQE